MRSHAAFHLKGRLRMAPKVPICATICLTLFLSLPGFLQALPLASVRGRITDPQGSPVSGVKLILTASGGLAAGATTSDSHGNFIFNNIAFGTYRLTAEAPGFISIQRVLEVTDPTVNVSLQFQKLSSTEQRVTVRASVPPVLAPDPSARTIEHDEALDANPGRPGAPISIPGLPIETASGGIKAPQYFAPGVAGDHGEPIAQYFQIGNFLYPNNLPANAHGNGYSDPNILIPPVIEAVEVDGGSFNVRESDHSVDLAATYIPSLRLEPFAELTGDDRDLDMIAGLSPRDSSVNEWLAMEIAVGNGFLKRLEHRHQYKLNGFREFKTGGHDISIFGIGYYGFSRLPGLIPIGVQVPDDTIDDRQLDRTNTLLGVASDTWQFNRSSQFLLSGFFREYGLTLRSNFGDGLIQQSESRTVAGGEGAYLAKLGHGFSLLAGTDLRRDAPRNLDLKHLNAAGLFAPVTSNNFTFEFIEPFVSLAGRLTHFVHFDAGIRQEELSFNNQDLLTPANSFQKWNSLSLPKATLTFLPPEDIPLPSLSLSAGEAFHTDDPRISTDAASPGPPTLITTSRAYRATLQKRVGRTDFRLILIRVANSEELANIDPDTGLQQFVGPSLNHALTAAIRHDFSRGSVEVSFSRADARDRLTGQPVPEAPRLIWDATGHWDRLPLRLRGLGEFEYVGAKPLGDGFVGVAVREIRGALFRSFWQGRMQVGLNFMLASGYTGQTLETLALPGEGSPFERIVGVPLKSYVTLSWTYHFRRNPLLPAR